MKRKNFFRQFRIGILSLFIGLLFSLTFLTEDMAQAARSFTIQQTAIDAEVLPDASMRVTERLTIDFSGQWNGFYIKIPQNNNPVVEVVVREKGEPFKFNSGTEYGPPGTYLLKTEGSQLLIDWSISARDEVRTFDVSYRVINAVKLHNDVAELYRKFIGDANQEKIADVKVNLKLPAGAEKYKQGEEIRIWGHGPLQGEVNFAGSNMVTWQVKNLPAYTFVEGRVVMPLALFSQAPAAAYTGQTALASILSQEQGWAQDANRQRWVARAEYAGGAGIVGGALAVVVLLWRKYGRSHGTNFEGDYYRDLPGSYSPAELSVLWNFRKMQAQDLTATIMDLARRKFLYLEEENIEVPGLFGNKEKTTYRLSFLPAPEPATLRKPQEAVLLAHEEQLIDFLKENIAKSREYLYLTDIEQYAKKNGKEFHEFWEEWKTDLNARGAELEFFDDNGIMPTITVLIGLGLFVLGSIIISKTSIIGFALVAAGAVLLFIPRLFKRRSISGQEDYVRWQAFKKFLEHFSEMERHEIPSLIIWEHFLVYAVTLGVAKEVIKQLELVFPNMQDGDYHFGYGWLNHGTHIGISSLHNSFDSIGDVMESSLKSAQKAVSKSSSGSGGGGGFSGGGGGGGGGSSYGGR